MHYHAEIWTPKNSTIESSELESWIERVMAPHKERYIEESDSLIGFWDWWQIGGRWTGKKDGYKPEEDENNKETCSVCYGTGKRNDTLGQKERLRNHAYTCNGCQGAGRRTKWPTSWAKYQGDIAHVSAISDKLSCFTMLIPDVKVLHREEWNGEDWVTTDFSGNVKAALRKFNITDGYLVTVDYHK
jgi:hypothetical protein